MACCQRAPVFDAGEEGGYVILFEHHFGPVLVLHHRYL